VFETSRLSVPLSDYDGGWPVSLPTGLERSVRRGLKKAGRFSKKT
jgi:hypothetical protein